MSTEMRTVPSQTPAAQASNVLSGEEALRRRLLAVLQAPSESHPTPLSQAEVCRRLRRLVGAQGIRRFILFGSFARGTQTWESDVDLIVITNSQQRFLDRYLALMPLLHNALRPHAVEPLIYTEAEYEALRSRSAGVVCTADAEGILIDV